MKNNYILGVFVLAAFVAGSMFISHASAQKRVSNAPQVETEARPEAIAASSLLVDDFTASTGSLLSASGWGAHSGVGTNSIATVSPGLTFPGYPSSGIGNAASMTTSGEDVNKVFAAQTTGSVYAAAMVNVSASQITGDYFFHLVDGPIGGNLFKGRLFVKKDPALTTFAFGIQRSSTANANYTGFIYNPGTTYLVVVKLTFVAGVTNDTVDLFVNPVLSGAEPAPTISAVADATTDAVDIRGVALRQGTAANAATVQVDGIRVARSWSDLSNPPRGAAVDFNGDGRTDFVVRRNIGAQRRWFYNTNGTGEPTVALDWGLNNDVDVPDDYDGDGKDDIAVWRPAQATQARFYILRSSDGTVQIETFGQNSDEPVVGDYDGDGKADVAVYRGGAQSIWFYRGTLNNPSGNITYVPWGLPQDREVPGDYDGDGKYDFVIARNEGEQLRFWMNQTTAGITTLVFGLSNDTILPGDWDGDGKTDIATARDAGGFIQWHYLSSSNNSINYIIFGASATDGFAQGDYDGDGKTDAAVWRTTVTNGFWTRNSSNGAAQFFQLGLSGDFPVINENSH